MNIEQIYFEISWFFHAWVNIMENHTRNLEVNDSVLQDSKTLIVCPPTDAGVETLSSENQFGATYLLCFSSRIEDIAKKYCRRHGIYGVRTLVAPFFSIPIDPGEFDVIYANCFFDSCPMSELNAVIDEMRRSLRQGGTLYAVDMGIPSTLMNRLWAFLFRSIPGPARGFHPVDVAPLLSSRGFTILQSQHPDRFGFPLHYVKAEKADAA